MIKILLNGFMGVLYIIIGGFVFATNTFIKEIPPIAAKALGVLFIAYGLFRIYRTFINYQNKNY